ncbi:NCS2 family permease [uncultured Flavonifractor sp.]|uniref:solute carrier family 23 protein n=1 Tax=uncultured Flavonifractor sp. TaxID=1193534 RepID=UPI0026254C09|nr:NCS2 family permease [uncultured Flavonifractor sp.]
MKQLDRLFRLSQQGTTLGRELRGGCTTFCSMVYLVLVIPGLLSGAGMDFSQVMTATCLIAAAGSIASGLVSNLPFTLAPGLGFPTLFTYTFCQKYGCTWQQALALVLLSGALYLALVLSPLRGRLNDALPMPFKFALSAGVGLFLTLSGLINAGLILADGNLVDMGTLAAPEPLLALLGIFFAAVLIFGRSPALSCWVWG